MTWRPVVYNTNGYDAIETLRLLDGVVDVWMPDLKFADAAVAAELSDVRDYPIRARAALAEMHRQVGDAWIPDPAGAGERGLLIRILGLPAGLAVVAGEDRGASTLSGRQDVVDRGDAGDQLGPAELVAPKPRQRIATADHCYALRVTLVGTTVRSIHLFERLGEGGMGEVYLGLDERLGRRVAVKVVRGERRGDSGAAARFRREAQILSRLEHPNICRLYELIEGDGYDLLVLELVAGRTLREALADGLDDGTRWNIAEQVCATLVAAHGLGIVHRDLKPDNVMLTADGIVKVLDFGVARVTGADAVDSAPSGGGENAVATVPDHDARSTFTELGAVMGTPWYMSPEQARGEEATAASDMYVLGLLLQELFTGRPPFEPGLPAEVVLQKARWGDTPPVSGLGPALTSLIEDLKQLRAIDRPTAAEAAARLRYIREGPRRRLRRLAIAVVAASLVIATVASALALYRTRRTLATEQRARAQAEAVNDFLRDMLTSAKPEERGIDVKVVDVLDGAAAQLDSAFDADPLQGAAVRLTLGRTYQALGLYPAAREHIDTALGVFRDQLGERHPDTLAARFARGQLERLTGELEAAESTLREVLAARIETLGADHRETVNAREELAVILKERGAYDESERLHRAVLDWRRSHLGDRDDSTLEALLGLANVYHNEGRDDESGELFAEILATRLAVSGPEHPATLVARSNLAASLAIRGQHRAAEREHAAVLAVRRRVLGPDHPDTLSSLQSHAIALRRLGRLDEAESELRDALERTTTMLGRGHPQTASVMGSLAILLKTRQDFDEAEALYREQLAIERAAYGSEHRDTMNTLGNLANVLTAEERYDEAEQVYRELLPLQERILGEDHRDSLSTRGNLAGLLHYAGRFEEAEAGFRDAAARCRRVFGPDHQLTLLWQHAIGQCLLDQGAYAEAEKVLSDVLERNLRLFGRDHPRTQLTRDALAEVYRKLGRENAAAELAAAGRSGDG